MKRNILLLILLAIVILTVTAIARPNGILAGDETYYHLQISSSAADKSLTAIERPLFLSQYDYILKTASVFFEPLRIMKIFGIILGAVCAILFYFIARKIIEQKKALYASIILILSPAFLFIFSTNSAYMIPTFLILLGIFLLTNENEYVSYFSIIPLLGAVINSFFVSVLVLLAYLTYYLVKKDKKYYLITSGVLVILTSIFYSREFILNYSVSNLPLLSNLFADFGGLLGVSVFTAIFFIAGIIIFKKRAYAYPILIFFIIAFLINYRTIAYTNLFVCAFAGVGLDIFIEKKWKLRDLKQTMNFLMICGILFSAVSHINIIKEMNPSQGIIDASVWLNNNAENDTVIFSSIKNSFVIENFAQRKVLLDPLFLNTGNFDILSNDSNDLLYSRDIEKTEKVLNKYNIGYIIVDKDMTNGEIWQSDSQGLLFLLSNQQKFPTVYNQGGVTIFHYVK